MFFNYISAKTGVKDSELRAAEHIDILTFNRIEDFNALTAYQQRTVSRVHTLLTSFEENNADMIECYLNQYSINGVGMSFDGKSWNLKAINGVAIPADLYALLRTTNLCYPAI